MADEREMSTSTRMSTDHFTIGGEKVAPFPPAGEAMVGTQNAGDTPGIFSRAVSLCASAYRTFLHHQKLRQFRKSIEEAPDSVSILNQYANYLESQAMRPEAAAVYGRLVTICRRQREADKAAVYCRKLDSVGNPDAARCYREMAILYSELSRYEDAASAARRVVELYLDEGQTKAATGYIRQLPAIGSRTEQVRAELLKLMDGAPTSRGAIHRPTSGLSSPHATGSPSYRPASSYATSPLSAPDPSLDDGVFLAGHMGRITPFDVVQIVESNSLTGRLDFQNPQKPGAIFFRDGHIVAAISGSQRGYVALKEVFTAEPGPFRVVVTDVVPADEFEERNNTGLVLDILRDIDEATEHGEEGHPELVRPGQDDFYL